MLVDHPYPRRRVIRFILRQAAGVAFRLVSRLEIEGRENLPKEGPVILAANHFHFADPVALLYSSRRQVEFIGGFRFPNAPKIVHFFPSLWGYFPVHRGGYSRASLQYALNVLGKGGVVGIFPEGGSWARVLRPPRPGTAFLAANSGAPVVPIAIQGFPKLFNSLRPHLKITIGRPIGPFTGEAAGEVAEPGKLRRNGRDHIGEEVMRAIAAMLPEEERGIYATDAAIREAAEEAARYPFDHGAMRGM